MPFIVQVACAKMPMSCWGRYKRVAVLEVEAGYSQVRMISERARGVVRIVRTWEKLSCGTTDRDAYSRGMREALALAEQLNRAEKSLRRRALRRDWRKTAVRCTAAHYYPTAIHAMHRGQYVPLTPRDASGRIVPPGNVPWRSGRVQS